MTASGTERLLLRTWQSGDAAFHRQLWAERDPRVPAHRRLTHDGHPSLTEMEDWIRSYEHEPAPGLLVVQRRGSGTVLGYCGLIENSVSSTEDPELAFDFLRAFWNHGYATEAASEVINRSRALGYRHLSSTVRAWNTASLRVLAKLGFVDTGEQENDDVHGDLLLLRKTL
ncbi:GNAT family N-acetyltransferase [Cryobacterium sp. PAMC25264]|uniref:GNAT family N-acetyltransferase n=1 Tax=Cryobacterium sp. PAMC25264 TaxID=2861288 RepID=UPI001C62D0A3|nr:GNAT family N-acetyltransferase [Cryobacterium sp. PAMC25264]QYF73145.1 GNAT family N-acetyltransferase [Cryobacterium sp. PAMC25264]